MPLKRRQTTFTDDQFQCSALVLVSDLTSQKKVCRNS